MTVIKKTRKLRSIKNVLKFVMAFVISVTFVTTAMAAEKKAPQVKGAGWSGEVVSVDTVGKTIIAKNEMGETTFDVSAAKFAKNAKFEDLKAGDKISVKYEVKNGNNMAISEAKEPAKKGGAKKSKHESTGEYVGDSVIATRIKAFLIIGILGSAH